MSVNHQRDHQTALARHCPSEYSLPLLGSDARALISPSWPARAWLQMDQKRRDSWWWITTFILSGLPGKRLTRMQARGCCYRPYLRRASPAVSPSGHSHHIAGRVYACPRRYADPSTTCRSLCGRRATPFKPPDLGGPISSATLRHGSTALHLLVFRVLTRPRHIRASARPQFPASAHGSAHSPSSG